MAEDPGVGLACLDERDVLTRLVLNAHDAAKVCGVTVRQLTYWTDRGLVPSAPGKRRNYNLAGLEKASTVKQLMAQGVTLAKAARIAEDLITTRDRQREQLSKLLPSGLARIVDEQLVTLGKQVDCYRQSLPLHLAVHWLRSLVGSLAETQPTRVVASPDGLAVVRSLTRRLDRAIDEIEHVLDVLTGEERLDDDEEVLETRHSLARRR